MIEKWGIKKMSSLEYWKNKRPSEREFTKVICNNIIIFKEDGKYYFGIANSTMTERERNIIKEFVDRR